MRGAAEDTTAKKATNIRKAENLKPEEKKKKKKSITQVQILCSINFLIKE